MHEKYRNSRCNFELAAGKFFEPHHLGECTAKKCRKMQQLFHVEQFELFSALIAVGRIVSRETIASRIELAFSSRGYLSRTQMVRQRGSPAPPSAYFLK
jgi:hypothetical protein